MNARTQLAELSGDGQLMPISRLFFFSWSSHLIPESVRPSFNTPTQAPSLPMLPHDVSVHISVSLSLPFFFFFFLLSPGPKNAPGFSRGNLSERYVAPWAGSESGIPFFRVLVSLPVPRSHPGAWCHDRIRVRAWSGIRKVSPFLAQPDPGVLVVHSTCALFHAGSCFFFSFLASLCDF